MPLSRQIQSPECLVKEIILKLFLLKFGMTKEHWCPYPPPMKNLEFTVHGKWKNSKNFFSLKFSITKKIWSSDPPCKKIKSPEYSVNEKIWKIFWSQIWYDQKKLAQTPLV